MTFLATVAALGNPGRYEVIETFVRPSARAAYKSAHRLARIALAEEQQHMAMWTVGRIVTRPTAPRYGSYHVEHVSSGYLRRKPDVLSRD